MTTPVVRPLSLVLLTFTTAFVSTAHAAVSLEVGSWAGYRGAISGNTALLGQRLLGPGGFGDVGVYDQTNVVENTWEQQSSLANVILGNPGIHTGAEFGGGALALEGDIALVGAPRNTEYVGDQAIYQAGRAYVFIRNGDTWSRQATLRAPGGPVANARFAISGDLDGQHALLISSGTDAAYLFTRTGSNWDDGIALAGGNIDSPIAASLDGSLAAVGTFSGTGHVDLWQEDSTWNHVAQIANPGPSDNLFAASIALSGDTLVVAARQEAVTTGFGPGKEVHLAAGVVYTYRFDGTEWDLEDTIANPDPQAGDEFGYSVAIDGNQLLIGVPGDDELGFNAGAAYRYQRSGSHWSLSGGKILADGGAAGQWFGEVVAIEDGSWLVAGSGRGSVGTAYFFAPGQTFPPGDATEDGKVNANDAAVLAQNWLQSVSGGAHDGDFNEDGIVNDLDASILAANWSIVTESAGTVPEPTTLGLLLSLTLASLFLHFGRVKKSA